MATQVGKAGGMTLGRGAEGIAEEKLKSYQDVGLCLTLIVLLAWALFVGLEGVNWPAISHAFRALVAFVR
jgi:hypothetical protein